jgi:hypothetical protein
MTLEQTTNDLLKLLYELEINLRKGRAGNKAAGQRVRTGSIKFEKVAKDYRRKSLGK